MYIVKRGISLVLIIALLVVGTFFLVGCEDTEGTEGTDFVETEKIPSEDTDNNETENGETVMSNIATFIITDQNGVDRTIKIQLHPDKAPISVKNFTDLANKGYYDGLIFHRIVPNGCLQGGGYKIEGNTILEAPDIPSIYGEFASNGWAQNDIKHVFGTISMARTSVPNSATSQFFLCIGSYPSWDGEYAAFGTIVNEKESIDNLNVLGESSYGFLDYAFQTFPYPILAIKSVRVA
ncbi:MAG: peptidylprolyl isomerase [Clostridia bacterium]|nr:peptidylprolyl isomerase [Clostridia bacterium]